MGASSEAKGRESVFSLMTGAFFCGSRLLILKGPGGQGVVNNNESGTPRKKFDPY